MLFYSEKKALSDGLLQISWKKNYWESSKLTDLKINPLRENHAHFISCKPPHKNHPREYFGTTLWFIQITTSAVEKSQILSVAFHLSTTVGWGVQQTCFPEAQCYLLYSFAYQSSCNMRSWFPAMISVLCLPHSHTRNHRPSIYGPNSARERATMR